MPATRIPGPPGLPFIGSLLDLTRNPLRTYLDARRDYGDVVRFSAGPPGLRVEFYMVFSPEGAQQVLGGQAANFRKENVLYEEVRTSIGNGLLTAQDADYQRQRRLIQPLFTRRRVDGYADAIGVEAEALVERWAAVPDGVVDAVGEMSRFALRAVARILFGTDVEAAIGAVRSSFPVLGAYILERGFAPVRVPRQWPTPGNRRALAAQEELYGVCDAIIERRAGAAERGGAEPDDLLGLLAAARGEDGERLDAAELRDQVLVFLLAGHETTATSLTFALHLLGRHPEEQKRAREEIEEVLGDRRPEAGDLERLPYLTRVLKEAMRLYPAAGVIGRRAVAECEIGGRLIPAGAEVVLSPWVTHRHPDHWEDPDRFDPDRFTPEREAARHRYAWYPFGGGPRACIGQHFSMLESVLALAALLRAFEVEAVDTEVPVGQALTLHADGPARIRLTAR
ncbi:cytochrome P450 [Kitasatospora atroaurantiaca]|uniref:Cytochrome P450 n=1 Tax=Kitasatospora atroaurantiaca TaxID=285545 RepID=A0A561EYA7_9ACTN|nr:cytochrome P450 [Kitasatospora atroaurantiaca]TWE20577.1 cytochrome P450 [Kitasatospora atroaurantiaca]